jgi:hypothetical protein
MEIIAMAETFISAQEAARRTGLSTAALARRRHLDVRAMAV